MLYLKASQKTMFIFHHLIPGSSFYVFVLIVSYRLRRFRCISFSLCIVFSIVFIECHFTRREFSQVGSSLRHLGCIHFRFQWIIFMVLSPANCLRNKTKVTSLPEFEQILYIWHWVTYLYDKIKIISESMLCVWTRVAGNKTDGYFKLTAFRKL